jgi:glucose-6-phosphate 1-dehydrogenase
VQITVAESIGVEGRGAFYEEVGAIRDIIQNHALQVLALLAMEPPSAFEAEAIRDEKAKLLHVINPVDPARVVRGQYSAGSVLGVQVPGYREESGVPPATHTDTFVALKMFIDNWRWADVPFYLRTGKRLPQRLTEVVMQFKRAPLQLFRDTPVECLRPNQLVLCIQPNEGIALRFEAKVPGPRVRLGTVRMDFSYADYFGMRPTTGYETLLYDAMIGDSTLFHRADIVETEWTVVEPILQAWEGSRTAVPTYAAGSWGPEGADTLMAQDEREWRRPAAQR